MIPYSYLCASRRFVIPKWFNPFHWNSSCLFFGEAEWPWYKFFCVNSFKFPTAIERKKVFFYFHWKNGYFCQNIEMSFKNMSVYISLTECRTISCHFLFIYLFFSSSCFLQNWKGILKKNVFLIVLYLLVHL